MKRHLFTFAVFFFLMNILNVEAQQKDFDRYALQFGIGSNFTIKNFNGSTFSGKYFFGENNGIRLDISFSASDQTQELRVNDETKTLEDVNTVSFFISPNYFIRPIKNDDVYFYLLAGPRLGFSYQILKGENRDPISGNNNSIKNTGIKIGAKIGSGVEYYFKENMSLSAEYALSLEYRYSISERNSTSKTYQLSRAVLFNPLNVLFGLSVYF